jgi:hypothetical protein
MSSVPEPQLVTECKCGKGPHPDLLVWDRHCRCVAHELAHLSPDLGDESAKTNQKDHIAQFWLHVWLQVYVALSRGVFLKAHNRVITYVIAKTFLSVCTEWTICYSQMKEQSRCMRAAIYIAMLHKYAFDTVMFQDAP